MRVFLILLGREIKAYFLSPIGYVVLFCFLFLTGFNFYITVSGMNQGPSELTVMEQFFNSLILWIGTLLSFPLITMRLFSEEYKMGTIESLMTAPVRDWQVVFSKYFGALFFYVMIWLPTPFYFPVFEWVTKTHAAVSTGAYIGSYTFMLLLGMFYISIGCLTSVLTKNQIVAAVMSLVAILVLFLTGLFALMAPTLTPLFRDLVGYFSSIEHMQSFSTGMIDSRPIVYYLSMTGFVLFITYKVFQSRKWRM
jgi:ABC-2 type transport system permease protein